MATRKTVTLLLALVMCISCIAVPAAAEGPVTVTFWNGFTGNDGEFIVELVEQFNQTNPWDIAVELDINASFQDKFVTAMASDSGPDMIIHASSSLYDYQGQILCLDDLWENTALKREDFIPTYLDLCTTNEGMMGFPMQALVSTLYWNKDLFAQAGLDPDTPPASYDDWTEIAKKITNPDRHIYGSGLSYNAIGQNASIMQMFGGLMISQNEDGSYQANFENNEGYQEFLSWFKAQYDLGLNPVDADIVPMFLAGQIGMCVDSPALITELEAYEVNYGISTLIENDKGGKMVPSFLSCFMITRCADDAKKLACERFLEWWFAGDGQMPMEETAVYRWSNEMGYPSFYQPLSMSEAYQQNKNVAAITITDPEYCSYSLCPPSFPALMPLYGDCLVPLFSKMVFTDETVTLLTEAQTAAQKIIDSIQ